MEVGRKGGREVEKEGEMEGMRGIERNRINIEGGED